MGSDHAIITWELALQEKFAVSRKMCNWHQVEWTRFRNRLREKMRQFSEPMLETPLHIDEVVTRFTTMMQQIVEEQVPIKRICHFSKEWWTPEIKQLRSLMRRAARIWQKYRTLLARAECLESRRCRQKAVRKSKQFCWRLWCARCQRSNPWQLLRKVNPKMPPIVDDLTCGDNLITMDRDKQIR